MRQSLFVKYFLKCNQVMSLDIFFQLIINNIMLFNLDAYALMTIHRAKFLSNVSLILRDWHHQKSVFLKGTPIKFCPFWSRRLVLEKGLILFLNFSQVVVRKTDGEENKSSSKKTQNCRFFLVTGD